MNLSHAYLDRVLASLSRVAEVSYRRIFNGVGIYHRGVQFALIINDRLYFRADDASRPLFMARGMQAFQPRVAVQVESSFFSTTRQRAQCTGRINALDAHCCGSGARGQFLR